MPATRPPRPRSSLALLVLTGLWLTSAAALADVVHTRDGRRLVGTVVEHPRGVIVKMRLGSVLVQRADILRIEPGDAVETVFRSRLAALAADDLDGRLALARWAIARDLRTPALPLLRALSAAATPPAGARELLVGLHLEDALARPGRPLPKAVALELTRHSEATQRWLGGHFGRLSTTLAGRVEAEGPPDLEACAARYLEARRQLLSLVSGGGYDDGASPRLRRQAVQAQKRLARMYRDDRSRPFVRAGVAPALEELRQVEDLALELGVALPAEAPHEAALQAVSGAAVDRAALDRRLGLKRATAAIAPHNAAFAGPTPPEKTLIGLINAYRDMLGRRVLRLEGRLCRAALGHSRAMVSRGFFAHRSPLPGRRDPIDRVSAVGYRWRLVGEVLARKSEDPADVFAAFVASPTHHTTLIDARFREIGSGKVQDYWTLELALRR